MKNSKTSKQTKNSQPVSNKIDFMILFDVKDGNPNGDPDNGNRPRFDVETMQGLVTDGCIKRKIRNFIQIMHPEVGIYVQSGISLESKQGAAYSALKLDPIDKSKSISKRVDDIAKARQEMIDMFWDVRAFGAVMNTTQFRCGQVQGPVQIGFARSIDPIQVSEIGITRVCYTKEKKTQESAGSSEMGTKFNVPYGLYRVYGHIVPPFANPDTGGTGFSEDDLRMLWEAILNMFEMDRSATRGEMNVRNLFVFEHSSQLGNSNADKLFKEVENRIRLADGVEVPRNYEDYYVPTVEELRKFKGVKITDNAASLEVMSI